MAGTADRLPLNDPIGVRTALTMNTSCAGASRFVYYSLDFCQGNHQFNQTIQNNGTSFISIAVVDLHLVKGEMSRSLTGTFESVRAEDMRSCVITQNASSQEELNLCLRFGRLE